MRHTSSSSKKFHTRGLLVVIAMLVVVFAVRSQTTSANVSRTTTESGDGFSENRPVMDSKPAQRPSSEVVSEFFRTHPDHGVREELHPLLRNGRVRVSWNVVGVAVAAFGVAKDERGELVPVLAMDPEIFHERNRSIAQVTIKHEYLHYLQWRDGTIPEETFLIRDSLSRDEIHDWCKEKWHAEVLAYHEACAFGRANGLVHGLRPGGPLAIACTAEGSRFVPTLKRVLTRADPSGPTCSSTWATL